MDTPTPRKRRPLPNPLQQLEMQASMNNTVQGQKAALKLQELEEEMNPTLPPTPAAETILPPAVSSSSLPAPEQAADVASATPVGRSSKKASLAPDTGTAIRIKGELGNEIKDALNHYRVTHKTRRSGQEFVETAVAYYLAHLRRTGKLPTAD